MPNLFLSRKQLLASPQRPWSEERAYDAVILVPTRKKHASGRAEIAVIGQFWGKIPDWIKLENSIELAGYCDSIEWADCTSDLNMKSDMLFPSRAVRFWSNKSKLHIKGGTSTMYIEIIRHFTKHSAG